MLASARVAQAALPASVRLPIPAPVTVRGDFELTGTENPSCLPPMLPPPVPGTRWLLACPPYLAEARWGFCQRGHFPPAGDPGTGILDTDDRFAWDMNLPDCDGHGGGDDDGLAVHAVEAGKVVRWAGNIEPVAGKWGIVLIEHGVGAERWWSGYLHMKDIQVKLNDLVAAGQEIGRISNVSEDTIDPHLHFAVYSGENVAAGLHSEDVLLRGVNWEEAPRGLAITPDALDPFTTGHVLATTQDADGPPPSIRAEAEGHGFWPVECSPVAGSPASFACLIEMRDRLLRLFACSGGNCGPPIELRPRRPAPTITSITRADGLPTLEPLPLPGRQSIVIRGTGFIEGLTTLHFRRASPAFTSPPRTPVFVNANELRYDIAVGGPPGAPAVSDWQAWACNGECTPASQSNSSSFHVECRPDFPDGQRRTIGASGGVLAVSVRAGTACPWAVSIDYGASSWLQVSSGSATGSGDGVLRLFAAPNTSSSLRIGNVRLGATALEIVQAAASCTFTIVSNAGQLDFPSEGGSRWVNVEVPAGCAWSVDTSHPWISIGDSGGMGDGVPQGSSPPTVPLEVRVAPASSATARTGEVRVHDASVVVTQQPRACTYEITPAEAVLGAENDARRISLDTDPACPWAATADPWIEILDSDDRGSGGITYRVQPFHQASERVGAIRVGGATHVVRQRGLPTATTPAPPDGATDVSRESPRLAWSFAGDPGAVEFAVRLGLTPTPPIHAGFGSINGTSHELPVTLGAGQKVYWAVVVRDALGVVREGPVWSFTTEQAVPDLRLRELQVVGAVRPGGTVTVNVTAENVGNYTADAREVRFYLSRVEGGREQLLTAPDSLWIEALEPGSAAVVSAPVILEGLQSGTSYVDAWVDTTAPTDRGEATVANDLTSLDIAYSDSSAPEITYARLGIVPGRYSTGRAYPFAFSATDDLGVVAFDLHFSTNGGQSWTPIALDRPVSGAPSSLQVHEWSIPSGLPQSHELLARVVARDPAGRSAQRVIGPYDLVDGSAPVVTVLSPNGGEAWVIGSTREVTWSAISPNTLVDVSVWFDLGATSLRIGRFGPPVPQSFSWMLPTWAATTNGRVRVRATDAYGAVGEDRSDGDITVVDDSAPPPPPWRPAEQVTAVSPSSRAVLAEPRVAAGPSGDVHLVYLASDPGEPGSLAGRKDEIRYQRWSGLAWSAPEVVVRLQEDLTGDWEAASNLAGPEISVGPGDQPHVTWQHHHATREQRNGDDVFHSTRVGGAWSMPVNVSAGVLADFTEQRITWTTGGSLPAPDAFLPGAVAAGRLHVFNHDTPGVGPRGLAFDPDANAWSELPAPIHPWGRQAAAIGDRIFLVSGAIDRRIQALEAGAWTAGAELPEPRGDHFAVAAVGGDVHVLGGESDVHRVYHPVSDAWSVAAPLPAHRTTGVMAAAVGTRIYVMGGDGQSTLRSIDVFDTATGAWSLEQTNASDVPAPAISGGAVALTRGERILVVGGLRGSDHRRSVFEYTPGLRAWRRLASLSAPRSFASAGLVGDKVIVAGGVNASGDLATTEVGLLSEATEGSASWVAASAVDTTGRLHVAWRDGTWFNPDPGAGRGAMRVHHRVRETSGAWSVVSSPFAMERDGIGLAASAGGQPTLAFVGPGGIATSEWTGDTWTAAATRSAALPNEGISVAIGSPGHRALAWTDPDSSNIDSLSAQDDAWEPLPRIPGARPTTLVDSEGATHLVWWTNDDVLYSTRTSGWAAPVVLTPASHRPAAVDVDAVAAGSTDDVHVAWVGTVNGRTQVFHAWTDPMSTDDVVAPRIVLTSPTGGAVLPMGQATMLRWQASDDGGIAGIDIDWSDDDGESWRPVTTGTQDDGEEDWLVPVVTSSTARVRVRAIDRSGNAAAAVSGRLSIEDITPPAVVLLQPSGGASVAGGAATSVAWEASDVGGLQRVIVEASTDRGSTWTSLDGDAADAGSLDWFVPNVETDIALVRVRAVDASDLTSVAVTSPPLRLLPADALRSMPHSPIPSHGAFGVSSRNVRLQWASAHDGRAGVTYEVTLGEADMAPAVFPTDMPVLDVGDLVPGATYWWSVSVRDGDVEAIGPTWAFSLVAPPATPTGLRASDGERADGVHMSWAAAAHATQYEVWRGAADAPDGVALAALPQVAEPLMTVSGTFARDETAVPDVRYSYWVVAGNAEGASEPSERDEGTRTSHVPALDVAPFEVSVDAIEGESTSDVVVVVTSPGSPTLDFSVTSSEPSWLLVDAEEGQTSGGSATVRLSFGPGLAPGVHVAAITFNSSVGSVAPVVVPVTLRVAPYYPALERGTVVRLGTGVADRAGGHVGVSLEVQPGSQCVRRLQLALGFDAVALALEAVSTTDAACGVSVVVDAPGQAVVQVECPAGLADRALAAELHFAAAAAVGSPGIQPIACLLGTLEACGSGGTVPGLACTAGSVHLGCLRGDVAPEGSADGQLTLSDYMLVRRDAAQGNASQHALDCADLGPLEGCVDQDGVLAACAHRDGALTIVDAETVRHLMQRTARLACVTCMPALPGEVPRRPGDVRRELGSRTGVTVADLVQGLAWLRGARQPERSELRTIDVVPGAGQEGQSIVAGGGDGLQQDDIEMLRGLALERDRMTWPERLAEVRVDAPIDRGRGVVIRMRGWPPWCEPSHATASPCFIGDGELDVAGETWVVTCVSDTPVPLVGTVAVIRYRAPERLVPGVVTVSGELVGTDLAPLPAGLTFHVQ